MVFILDGQPKAFLSKLFDLFKAFDYIDYNIDDALT